ncbi:MAG: sugar transferase [Lachnospiraceae bacterium]|nr:sugar transferase [Lachnospiraceae bacterium]
MYQKNPSSFIKHIDFMILDLVCFLISIWLAYVIHINQWEIWESQLYRSLIIIIALIHICVSAFDNNYKNILRRGYLKEFTAVTKHVATVIAMMLIFNFFLNAMDSLSRMVVVYTAIISLLMIWLERTLWKKYVHYRLAKNPRLLLMVTDEAGAVRILEQFQDQMLDFQVNGIVLVGENPDGIKEVKGISVVANAENLTDYLLKSATDEILFSIPPNVKIPQNLIRDCSLMGITIHLEIISSDELAGARYEENIAGITVMTSYLKLITVGQAFFKRAMDIAGGIVGLIFTGIAFLFVAPAIYISDPGPVFFGQDRVGKNGRIFKLYKFRSMYQDAEARKAELMEKNEMKGQMFKIENDPRIIGSGADGTKHGLGHFLRASSIDELPQFWNVLKGDMSLVGTRPPLISEVSMYNSYHRARLSIKPGITGLWQVSGRSDIDDFEDVVKLDTQYIQNWSLSLDIKILIKTVAVVFARKGSR